MIRKLKYLWSDVFTLLVFVGLIAKECLIILLLLQGVYALARWNGAM